MQKKEHINGLFSGMKMNNELLSKQYICMNYSNLLQFHWKLKLKSKNSQRIIKWFIKALTKKRGNRKHLWVMFSWFYFSNCQQNENLELTLFYQKQNCFLKTKKKTCFHISIESYKRTEKHYVKAPCQL